MLAGVIVGLKTHGFRRGHFQEVAHLGSDLGGAASYAVAQAGGHNHKSMTLGVTAEYAGGIDRHLYNDRAQASYASPYAPKVVAESYIPAKLTSKEIDAYIKENSYESRSKADRDKFIRELRLRRQKEWMEQQSDNAGKSEPQKHFSTCPCHMLIPPSISSNTPCSCIYSRTILHSRLQNYFSAIQL